MAPAGRHGSPAGVARATAASANFIDRYARSRSCRPGPRGGTLPLGDVATNRLELAGEEAFQYLLDRQAESKPHPIRVAVRPIDDDLQIELVSGPDSANLEVRLDALDDEHEEHTVIRDVGPRILRHVAKEVRHEQFYDLDVLTVTVDTRPLV